MNKGLLVLGQGNQCGSVGVWEASLFVWLLLAPPGSSWLPPGCGWLLLAPPGSSRLLLAPPALHPPLASAVRPWGARAVLRPEHSRGGRMVSKWLYHPYDMQPSKFVTGSMGTQQWPLEFRSPPPVPRLLQAPRGPLPPQAPSGTIKERCPEDHKGPCKALYGNVLVHGSHDESTTVWNGS